MDLGPYVESLRQDLAAFADTGEPSVRDAGQRLATAIEPSARLALLEALSAAAAEITASLRTASVEARLRGRAVDFVVADVDPGLTPPLAPHPPAPLPPLPPPPPGPPTDGPEDGGLARVTLRLPEPVKARAEALAQREGMSLNTWLVQVLRRATGEDTPWSGAPTSWPAHQPAQPASPNRMSGWI